MMKILLIYFGVLIISFQTLVAQTTNSQVEADTIPILKIGVKHTPPFIMNDNGSYQGVCVDLWQNIASQLNLKYEFVEYDLQGLLLALENEEIDVCINPLTVTSDRIEDFDFTQPFYISELSVAVSEKLQSGMFGGFKDFFKFTINFLKAVSVLFGVIFVFGLIIWLAERKKNPQFDKKGKGIFDGIWWSAVTMTTVGYGDKSPVTKTGRIFATIWMFTSIIIISSLTASIAASLTVNQFSSVIENTEDLRKVKTATVNASSSQNFLIGQNIDHVDYKTIEEGIDALRDQKIAAFVYDGPILRYLVKEKKLSNEIFFVDNISNSEYYSFALPHNSQYLKEVNRVLIQELESIRWKGILNKYSLKKN